MLEVLRTMIGRGDGVGELRAWLEERAGQLHEPRCTIDGTGERVRRSLQELLDTPHCSHCRSSMLFGSAATQPMRLETWAGLGRELLEKETCGSGTTLAEMLEMLEGRRSKVLKPRVAELGHWHDEVAELLGRDPRAVVRTRKPELEAELLRTLVDASVRLPEQLALSSVPALEALERATELARDELLRDQRRYLVCLAPVKTVLTLSAAGTITGRVGAGKSQVISSISPKGSMLIFEEAWGLLGGGLQHVVRSLHELRRDLFLLPAAALPWVRENLLVGDLDVVDATELSEIEIETVKVLHSHDSSAYRTLGAAVEAAQAL